ncbi:MAG: hypothetical protein JSS07_00250 [Proteobacteria bacterium]|nr:hypothetical protein [Pseudomonadota bacterium]
MKTPCPCNNENSYEACCGAYIECDAFPLTPEALMRSRYSAFVLGKISYLKNTMKGLPFDEESTKKWLENIHWEGLKIIQTQNKSEQLGFVSFMAKYTCQGKKLAICEKSEFHKINDRWFYVGGKALNPNKSW